MRKQLYPCAKNGKFIGYADKDQIAANKNLSIFDPAVVEKKVNVEQEQKAEPEGEQVAGADPSAVRRKPGQKGGK